MQNAMPRRRAPAEDSSGGGTRLGLASGGVVDGGGCHAEELMLIELAGRFTHACNGERVRAVFAKKSSSEDRGLAIGQQSPECGGEV